MVHFWTSQSHEFDQKATKLSPSSKHGNGTVWSGIPYSFSIEKARGGGGGGTPIYFLGRDVPTVRVSFSGSSVLNRVYIFRFSCLKQRRPHISSPFLSLRSHNFRWFRAPSLKCVKTQTYVPLLVFWIRPAWSSLEQGKTLQHFLLDRVAKFTSFVSWTGSGFRWVGRTLLLKFLLSTHPGEKNRFLDSQHPMRVLLHGSPYQSSPWVMAATAKSRVSGVSGSPTSLLHLSDWLRVEEIPVIFIDLFAFFIDLFACSKLSLEGNRHIGIFGNRQTDHRLDSTMCFTTRHAKINHYIVNGDSATIIHERSIISFSWLASSNFPTWTKSFRLCSHSNRVELFN